MSRFKHIFASFFLLTVLSAAGDGDPLHRMPPDKRKFEEISSEEEQNVPPALGSEPQPAPPVTKKLRQDGEVSTRSSLCNIYAHKSSQDLAADIDLFENVFLSAANRMPPRLLEIVFQNGITDIPHFHSQTQALLQQMRTLPSSNFDFFSAESLEREPTAKDSRTEHPIPLEVKLMVTSFCSPTDLNAMLAVSKAASVIARAAIIEKDRQAARQQGHVPLLEQARKNNSYPNIYELLAGLQSNEPEALAAVGITRYEHLQILYNKREQLFSESQGMTEDIQLPTLPPFPRKLRNRWLEAALEENSIRALAYVIDKKLFFMRPPNYEELLSGESPVVQAIIPESKLVYLKKIEEIYASHAAPLDIQFDYIFSNFLKELALYGHSAYGASTKEERLYTINILRQYAANSLSFSLILALFYRLGQPERVAMYLNQAYDLAKRLPDNDYKARVLYQLGLKNLLKTKDALELKTEDLLELGLPVHESSSTSVSTSSSLPNTEEFRKRLEFVSTYNEPRKNMALRLWAEAFNLWTEGRKSGVNLYQASEKMIECCLNSYLSLGRVCTPTANFASRLHHLWFNERIGRHHVHSALENMFEFFKQTALHSGEKKLPDMRMIVDKIGAVIGRGNMWADGG